jgi:glycosyltransferase involved in cell wall biosynthesis
MTGRGGGGPVSGRRGGVRPAAGGEPSGDARGSDARGGAGRAVARWRLLWRLLLGEGPQAVANRLRDRLAEARRRRAFQPAAALPPGVACAVLNLASAAPSPRLGGVQGQLDRRLAAEAELRTVALLYPEAAASTGGGFRLEVQRGRERWALRLPPASATSQEEAAGDEATGQEAAGEEAAGEEGPGEEAAGGDPGTATAPAARGGEPRPYTRMSDPALERAVAWAASLSGATAIVIDSLAGMPPTSLLRLHEGGLKLILAAHDFALFCPRPHLLERLPPPAPPRFCHYSRDAMRCARCLDRDVAGLPPGYQEERREQARRLLTSAAAVVYPSAFLARAHDDLFAVAGASAARIIPPAGSGSASAASTSAWPPAAPDPDPTDEQRVAPASPAPVLSPSPPATRAPRHIAWVGAVQPHKGALVFEAAVRSLAAAGRRPRLTAYGGGDPEILRRWRRLPGLRVRGHYRAGSLPALLARDGVDLALLLSVVPESYGLTLDECADAGVPVLAFDVGAIAERIAAAGSGLLLAAALVDDHPAAAGAALATLLADLLDGRVPMPPPAPPRAAADPGNCAAVVAAWMELYRDLGLHLPGTGAG